MKLPYASAAPLHTPLLEEEEQPSGLRYVPFLRLLSANEACARSPVLCF